MNTLKDFGWSDYFAQQWQMLTVGDVVPARVVADFGTSCKIALPEIQTAELSGKLAHYTGRQTAPKVGDWVAVRPDHERYIVEAVLPRRSQVARKVAGKRTQQQILAANVDVAFIVVGLDNDFSVERLKRYLYQLSVDNIRPIIVLNKADKVPDTDSYLSQLAAIEASKLIVSARNGLGIGQLQNSIGAGQTAIMMGSSGVGKSTLTNRLLGREVQATRATRSFDDTGRHTTVHRELFRLPGGGLLIDSPGIRELQLWGTEDALDENFDDIARIAAGCKYTSCSHQTEPGCAIHEALEQGALSRTHYSNYQKMKGELAALRARRLVQQKQFNRRSRK